MSTTLHYTVLSGDSYPSIANALALARGLTPDRLEAANPDKPATALKVGELLAVPTTDGSATAFRYTIRPGDDYWAVATAIANSAGIQPEEIEAANPNLPARGLREGEVIDIPAAGAQRQPTPPPQPRPAPVTDPSPHPVEAPHIGYWSRTWMHATPPAGATLGLAFSGWTDPGTALSNSATTLPHLVGAAFLSLGGGNDKGAFTKDSLASVDKAIEGGVFAAYKGLAYDVEVGDSGLSEAFATSFAKAKAAGLEVLVTISHSAPYGISDGAALMESFFANGDIDYLSPQLYTTGSEAANEWATSHGVAWSSYAQAKALVLPSIVHASYYPDAEKTLAGHGVTTQGYIVWNC